MTKPKKQSYYRDRPKRGKGRKAWDRYVKEKGEKPFAVSYTNSYDYELRGWVCSRMAKDGVTQWIQIYSDVDHDVFYNSSDFVTK